MMSAVTQSLVFNSSGARERRAGARVASSRVREVDSCAELFYGEYKWHVARLTDPDSLPPWRRVIFLAVHRGGPQVPSGRIPATCGTFDIREQAERACRDPWDYLYREPHGLLLKAGSAGGPENFCRPRWEEHRELNAREAAKFSHERLMEAALAAAPPLDRGEDLRERADAVLACRREVMRRLDDLLERQWDTERRVGAMSATLDALMTERRGDPHYGAAAARGG